jgi:hypothetical protein
MDSGKEHVLSLSCQTFTSVTTSVTDGSVMTACSKISLFEHFGREAGQIYRPTMLSHYRPGQVLRAAGG